MRIDPGLISYFTAVASFESISRAADSLGVSASTVSRKIDEAELALGARLFDRDTRHLRLTEAGHDYFHYANKALQLLEQGQEKVARYNKQIIGALRIWSPPAFGREYLASAVSQFGVLHPQLKLSLQLEAKPFALGSSEFDVGICVGMPTEGRVVISRLCNYQSSFMATPAFFQKYGTPQSLQSLAKLPIVTVFHEQEINQHSVLESDTGEQISYTSKLAVNDSFLALEAVLSGQYIGKLMHWYVQTPLLSGLLHKVLPTYSEEKSIYAVVQARKGNPRKVQLFVDFLKSRVQPAIAQAERRTACLPYWADEAR
jgi:DNA-binding transcriptional LysR family regulator